MPGFDRTISQIARIPSTAWTVSETMRADSTVRPSFVNRAVYHQPNPTGCVTVTAMAGPARTVRSERTREALRQAALGRFLTHGVEETSAEQIAADAGVSLRTFYRHFRSKHDLLFADYTGLHWFRAALDDRPADEPIIDSVQSAIFSFPYDVEAVTKIATLRGDELDPGRIVRHIQEVQADFADAIQAQLQRRSCAADRTPDERLRIAV